MSNITKEFKHCKHNRAFYYNQKHDYEMRVWDMIYCPDCKSLWEERCIESNMHRYPKGNLMKAIMKG